MATILDKDIIRETTVKFDDREVQITLTDKQTIYMKLKGMKSGGLEISIEDLYRQLKGDVAQEVEVIEKAEVEDEEMATDGIDLSDYKGDDGMLISIYDIRHYSNIQTLDLQTKMKFDNILSDLIKERKETKGIK
jgi:hypothetical protein